MRIAFASINEGIDGQLSPHFGRCPYYVFVDVDGEEVQRVETLPNPFYENHQPGAIPQFIAQQRADVVIAGGMGPRAISWFQQLGVTPVTTAPRSIREILDDYLRGRLEGAESCEGSEHEGHHGHHHSHHHFD